MSCRLGMLTTMRLRAACTAVGLREAIFSTVGLLGLSSVLFILRQGRQAHYRTDGRDPRMRFLLCRSQRPTSSHARQGRSQSSACAAPGETTACGLPVGAGKRHRWLGEQPLGTGTMWEETGEHRPRARHGHGTPPPKTNSTRRGARLPTSLLNVGLSQLTLLFIRPRKTTPRGHLDPQSRAPQPDDESTCPLPTACSGPSEQRRPSSC